MVSTVLRRSTAFSVAVLLLFALVGGSLLNRSRVGNYLFEGIYFTPFVLTLITSAAYCLFHKYYLKDKNVQSMLFLNSFQRFFDTWCCLALAVLCWCFCVDISTTYVSFYIFACLLVTLTDAGDYNSYDLDAIESERISTVKVFLLALALTPIAGYIAVRMYKSEQNKKTETMKLHLERAKAYLEAKDFTNAILECKEGLNGADTTDKLKEGNFDQRNVRYDILHVLAEIYCEQGKYYEAIISYNDATRVFLNNKTKARQCISCIVHNEWVDMDIGTVCRALHTLEAYERFYSDEEYFSKERIRLMQITEGASDKYEKSAKVYLEQKDYANAIVDFTKAIEFALLTPEFALSNLEIDSINCKSYYYGKRAEVYLKQEDYANAIADYTKAIKLAPTDYKSYYYRRRADMYLQQGDYANAIADYTKAIELEEDSFFLKSCYDERAEVYLKQKDFANAIADYTKAIENVPSDEKFAKARIYKKRGEAHQMLGDMEQAEADFAKAKEIEAQE